MRIWQIETLNDGRIELTAPNGIALFTVSPDTAEMIARMLLDEVEAIEKEWDDDDELGPPSA